MKKVEGGRRGWASPLLFGLSGKGRAGELKHRGSAVITAAGRTREGRGRRHPVSPTQAEYWTEEEIKSKRCRVPPWRRGTRKREGKSRRKFRQSFWSKIPVVIKGGYGRRRGASASKAEEKENGGGGMEKNS